MKVFKDLPFPVCLFFFTLDNDKGYYRWILEPIIKEGNNVALKFNENQELKKEIQKLNDLIQDFDAGESI